MPARKKESQSKPVAPNPAARLLTVKETAGYLGCTVWFAHTLAWNRVVPYLKLGKRKLFDKADLDSYIEKQKQVMA